MARIDVPEGPGGEAAMVWTMRPKTVGMVAIDDELFDLQITEHTDLDIEP
jgi:hypothetical protein